MKKYNYNAIEVEKAPKYCKNKHYVILYDSDGKKVEAGIFYMNTNLTRKQRRIFKDIWGM